MLCIPTGLIMRFRIKGFALSADIEAMFMQVSVPPSDRRFLRYLWRNEVHEYNRHIVLVQQIHHALLATLFDNAPRTTKLPILTLQYWWLDTSTWTTSMCPLIPSKKQRICAKTSKLFQQPLVSI